MTRVPSQSIADAAMRNALAYLTARADALRARAEQGDKTRGPYKMLAAYIARHGEQDEKGSRTWLFGAPVAIDGVKYAGLRMQASRRQPYIDPEKGLALLASLGEDALQGARRTEVTYDLEHLFLLRQTGQVTREQLADVMVTPEAEYSLTAVKAA